MSITNQAGETPRDVARRFSKLACVKLLGRDPLLRGEQEDVDGKIKEIQCGLRAHFKYSQVLSSKNTC